MGNSEGSMRRCSHREEMHPIDRVKVYIISPDKFPVNLYNYHITTIKKEAFSN